MAQRSPCRLTTGRRTSRWYRDLCQYLRRPPAGNFNTFNGSGSVYPMKKFIILIVALLLFTLPQPAQAGLLFYSWVPSYTWLPPYNCASNVAGFSLMPLQGVYRLTGPVYVPLPGYTYTVSPVTFDAANPADAEATLTLIPPSNTIGRLGALTVVPPLFVDYSFSSTVPVRRLTVFIANPVNRFDTQITCLLTGATQ